MTWSAAKMALTAAIVTTLLFAWAPHPPALIAYEKAQHGLAFVVLVILGRIALPRTPWQVLVLALVALGAVIEVVQSVPQLHRTCVVYDWYADVFAILIGLAAHTCVALLRSTAGDRPAGA